jgi:hypothetical protein
MVVRRWSASLAKRMKYLKKGAGKKFGLKTAGFEKENRDFCSRSAATIWRRTNRGKNINRERSSSLSILNVIFMLMLQLIQLKRMPMIGWQLITLNKE